MEGRRDLAKGRGECNERIPLALGRGRAQASGERASVSQGRNGLCPDPEGEEQLPPLLLGQAEAKSPTS